ncbi:MAG: hypothetical protein COV69_00930 [Parcubacteria group bacterium CG11_big_fil_rev_8_21_14_0_20_39_14]|nr:MAG: hypothetical protein COV69_00930 [Parcubacteria group bacterium CG11_big_fil_rev_8_21_14_0_20_39_14]PIS35574.1 MAG: hypothetical protein COT36_01730 [Parcubacteria group bacterium CG08_land_8_20_14_0_20_38_56]
MRIVVYTDGGSRGNPGPAAIGVVISDGSGKVIREYSQFLGQATNNEAEYQALIFALKKIKQLFGKKKAKETEVECRMDSELISKQLNGEYKIEEPSLQPLFLRVWNLKIDFGKVVFKHIFREENKRADRLANQALNQEEGSQKLF